jgi:hypothetical protein
MENFDSLFDTQTTSQPEQPFDKEAWAEKKQAQRAELYEKIDEMADRTLYEPDMLAAYLKMQAYLGRTSVSNTLLITAQKPDATRLMSFEDWQQRGRSVKRNEKALLILEANGEYQREDGSMATSYDVKHVFDVSQTHGKPVSQRVTFSMPLRAKLKALMTGTPVPVKPSERVSENIKALYSPDDNTVYVARTQDWNKLFFAIARELARADGAEDTFRCDCVANIVCERFGIPSMECDRIPDEYAALDVREKRGVLGEIREAANDIIERTDRNLYAEYQQRKNQPEK